MSEVPHTSYVPDDSSTWIKEPPGTDETRQKQKRKPNGKDHGADGTQGKPEDFAPRPWVYRDPTLIPPREWLLGTTLLRGYATVLGSMGGVGKTAYAIATALAVITGRRDIIDQHVFQKSKVWIITLKDDREELERRIGAAMIEHRIPPEEVEGKLFVNDNTNSRPLLLAKVDERGVFVVCEDAERLTDGIKENDIALTIIDPLVKAHAVIENSNEHMDRLMGLANDSARITHSAILLACHFRKGGGEDGARDAIRGGGALVDGARITRTLMQMTAVEAEAFKLPPHDAFRHIRIQDPKANLAPKETASWFQLVSVPLGNRGVNPIYPAGDNVQASRPWTPPTAFDGIDLPTLERIFDRLRREPEPGWFYSMEARAKFKAADVLIKMVGRSKTQATTLLKTWLTNGVLAQESYKTPTRNDATRLVLNEVKIAEMLAPVRGFGGDE